MRCPVCKSAMIVLEVQEIEIDHCLDCGGVWLDGGELELLLENAAARDALLASFAGDPESTERRRKCPICSRSMEKVTCGTDCPVLLDRCVDNDGIWFDKGELYELMRMGEFPGENRVFTILNDIFGKTDDSDVPRESSAQSVPKRKDGPERRRES